MRTKPSINATRWLAIVALAACESANPLDEAQINAIGFPDQFTFSVTALDEVTDGRRYLWTVTGPRITVDVTSGITSGSAVLQIRGGDAQVVYSEDIRDAIDTLTVPNVLGQWQIDVVLEKATGEFSFALAREAVAEP